MNSYPLYGENRSPFCRGSWDNDNKKFLNTNSIDVIQCCLNSCKSQVSYCFDTCQKTYGPLGKTPNYFQNLKCNEQCSEIISNCESGCSEIDSQGLKIIGNCAKDNGCELLNQKCLRDKKDVIIDCCKKTCIVNQSIDCEGNFCDNFYNGIQSPLEIIKKSYNVNRDMFVNNVNYKHVYVFCLIFFVLAIVGIYIIKLKK
jgi:hypothetical protein